MIPEYCTFSVSDKAHAKNLHDIGIRTYHILRYLVAQKGRYANLSFNQKDMYNLNTQHRKEKVKGGDANAAISYLRVKARNDSYFFGKSAGEKDKNSEFLNDLKKLIYANVSVEEFEFIWGDIVEKHNLSSNSFVLYVFCSCRVIRTGTGAIIQNFGHPGGAGLGLGGA
ncbi:hypothetical protein Ahy_A05g025788 [Arachis hypogaea]|uniref:Protein FAR1-RELATED SEQUENCE n=1 Tax=Arachis hypogaea TaxID=3818 RepID=A0A445D9H3_ARAHY|nr:hypothetical protein Ahy_A05g025788 [Arachis hypogaea]